MQTLVRILCTASEILTRILLENKVNSTKEYIINNILYTV